MIRKLVPAVCLLVLSSVTCAATYTFCEPSALPDGAYLLDVNNHGEAFGVFVGSDGRWHTLRCSLQGEWVDLGPSYGLDINDLGRILSQGPASYLLSDPDGTVLDLGLLISGQSYPQRMNDSSWVAGYALYSVGRYRAFLWSAEAGTLLLPVPLGDVTAFAADVNNCGQVIGYSLDSAQSYARPFIWSGSTGLLELSPVPDATHAMPSRINDLGQIIGTATGYLGYRSVLWNTDGSVVDLGAGDVADLNNNGQVVIREYPLSYVLNPDGSRDDLPMPDGAMMTQAYGMNDQGVVVGKTITSDGRVRAAVWEKPGEAEATVIVAMIDIQPNKINLKSKGYIACFIEFPPDGPSPEDIQFASLKLAGIEPARDGGIGDYDNDGIPDLMVQFSREALRGVLQPGLCTLALTGCLADGVEITGECTLSVISPGK